MLGFRKKSDSDASAEARRNDEVQDDIPQRPWMETALPVFACGAGLFSDGYINNVSSTTVPLWRFPNMFRSLAPSTPR
jgi:hypothetical protein